MTILRDLRIARKFAYAFGAVCLLCTLLGTTALVGFLKVSAGVHTIVNNSMASISVLGEIRYSVATIRRTDALLLLCDTPACTARLAVKRVKYIASYDKMIADYAPLVSLPGEHELYETIRQNAAAYIAFSDQSRQLAESGNNAEASKLLLAGDAVKVYNVVADAVEADVALNQNAGASEGASAIQLVHALLIVIGVVMAVTVMLCAMIGITLTRLIVPPPAIGERGAGAGCGKQPYGGRRGAKPG